MSTLQLSINRRTLTTLLMLALLAAAMLTSPRSALAQAAGKPSAADAARIEQLMNEIATMQSEMAKLKRRIVELERENAELKASGATVPDKKGGSGGGGSGGGGKPGEKGGKGDFAAVPAEPLAAPEAALASFAADYAAKVKSSEIGTPAERQKTLGEVGGWARSAKKVRGKAEWTIELKGVDPDPLKGGGSIRFSVVDPVSKKAYSDLIVTQPLNPAQMRAVNDKSDVKHWKLTGIYGAEPKVNKDLENGESNPMFIGLFAEMVTTLSVQSVTPAN